MPKVNRQGNRFKIEPTYEEEREKYLKEIREAQDLGEIDKVAQLKDEWRQKKQKLGK